MNASQFNQWTRKQIERADTGPEPKCCPKCHGPLKVSRGYVGEAVLYCPEHGMVWEDGADAVRRVI